MSHGKAFFLALMLPGTAFAQDSGARAQGRDGVGRADGADAGSISENLAAASLDPHYNVVTGAALGPDHHFRYHAGAIDTRTSVVSLGAGYYRLTDNVPPASAELPGWMPPDEVFDNPAQHQGAFLGLAVPFLERKVSLSVTGRYDWENSIYGGKDTTFNFGFGAAVRPVESLTFAAGIRDLLDTGYSRNARRADLGVRFSSGPFIGVEANAVAPLAGDYSLGAWGWHGGADIGFTKWFTLRGGASFSHGVTSASAGIGLVSEHACLDYGMKIETKDPSRHWHALDLTVLF